MQMGKKIKLTEFYFPEFKKCLRLQTEKRSLNSAALAAAATDYENKHPSIDSLVKNSSHQRSISALFQQEGETSNKEQKHRTYHLKF